MPWGLKRYYGTGNLHFITWSCYRRKALLGNSARRDLLLAALELMRVRYRFAVIGYVVMPEHVHLLISEPLIGDPSKIVQAVKLSVSRRLAIAGKFSGRFWQSRFYDFNLWGQQKEVEKLKYMHRNLVVRALAHPLHRRGCGCPIHRGFRWMLGFAPCRPRQETEYLSITHSHVPSFWRRATSEVTVPLRLRVEVRARSPQMSAGRCSPNSNFRFPVQTP